MSKTSPPRRAAHTTARADAEKRPTPTPQSEALSPEPDETMKPIRIGSRLLRGAAR